MNEVILRIFAIFGAVTIFCGAVLLLAIFLEWLHEQIRDLKYTYRVKHRYGKKPIAKCHCGDCAYFKGHYDDYDGYCDTVHRYMYSGGFCSLATPRDKEEENEEMQA